jgi:hypothetical protein
MTYVDLTILKSLSREQFKNAKPFPFATLPSVIPDAKFEELRTTFPDISLFTKSFGLKRAYGQKPHDRYELLWRPDLALSPAWKQFIAELQGADYRREIDRILGTDELQLFYWWQRAVAGCSVSPHCDSPVKLMSHIFYFNSSADWKDEWGGRTLLLDDGGKFDEHTAPEIADFTHYEEPEILGNRTLLFGRTPHSWHAVKPLACPPGVTRNIFTVIARRKPSLKTRILKKLGFDPEKMQGEM